MARIVCGRGYAGREKWFCASGSKEGVRFEWRAMRPLDPTGSAC